MQVCNGARWGDHQRVRGEGGPWLGSRVGAVTATY